MSGDSLYRNNLIISTQPISSGRGHLNQSIVGCHQSSYVDIMYMQYMYIYVHLYTYIRICIGTYICIRNEYLKSYLHTFCSMYLDISHMFIDYNRHFTLIVVFVSS